MVIPLTVAPSGRSACMEAAEEGRDVYVRRVVIEDPGKVSRLKVTLLR